MIRFSQCEASFLHTWCAAQMGRQNGERLMVVSLFWTDIDELVQLRSILMGADLKEIEGTIELSQKPGIVNLSIVDPLFDDVANKWMLMRCGQVTKQKTL
jgi:hypothetical protein